VEPSDESRFPIDDIIFRSAAAGRDNRHTARTRFKAGDIQPFLTGRDQQNIEPAIESGQVFIGERSEKLYGVCDAKAVRLCAEIV
jgi:hypothetical protein